MSADDLASCKIDGGRRPPLQLCYLVRMPLSRRQFFRRFWSPVDKDNPERIARYAVLETYVRTHLLPYDFSLSAEQESELFDEVRDVLDKSTNEELFSITIRGRIEEVVESTVHPWREQAHAHTQSERIREIRASAPDYVSAFLTLQATPTAVEALKQRFGIEDAKTLEMELKTRIQTWVNDADDEQILQYDIFTVKDLVFAQLRSWC